MSLRACTQLALGLLVSSIVGCATSARPALPGQRGEVAAAAGASTPLARVTQPIGAANAEQVKLRWEALPGGFTRGVAVSSGLQRVAFGNEKSVHIYQLSSGKSIGRLETCTDLVRGGLFFHQGQLWVVCTRAVRVHDLNQRSELAGPELAEAAITATAWSGSKLALAHRDGVIRVHDVKQGSVTEIAVPGPPIDVKSLALDQQGKRVAVAWVQGSIWWWQLDQPTLFHKLVRHEAESDSVAFAPSGVFAEEGKPGYTTLWELAAGEATSPLGELRNGAWIKRLLFTTDSKWLVRGGADGLDLAEVGGPKRLVLESAGKVEDVALDETGSVIVSGDRVGRLKAFAVPRGR